MKTTTDVQFNEMSNRIIHDSNNMHEFILIYKTLLEDVGHEFDQTALIITMNLHQIFVKGIISKHPTFITYNL